MLTVDDALALCARGFSVFPVPAPGPATATRGATDGKTPSVAWRQYQTHRPPSPQVRTWFASPTNAGVVTGAISGLVVVDCDGPDALKWATRNLPYTPWQVGTARGHHLYYRHPGGLVRNRAGLRLADGQRLAVDVRGDGGYVVAPGSTHRTGVRYLPSGGWHDSLDNVPVYATTWLPHALPPPPPGRLLATMTRPRLHTSNLERARRYLSAIPRPEIGSGSDHACFYAAARLVRGFGLDDGAALELLDAWAGGRHGWNRAWLAEKVRSAGRYATEPIGRYLQ